MPDGTFAIQGMLHVKAPEQEHVLSRQVYNDQYHLDAC